jgi:hypothetical protein
MAMRMMATRIMATVRQQIPDSISFFFHSTLARHTMLPETKTTGGWEASPYQRFEAAT